MWGNCSPSEGGNGTVGGEMRLQVVFEAVRLLRTSAASAHLRKVSRKCGEPAHLRKVGMARWVGKCGYRWLSGQCGFCAPSEGGNGTVDGKTRRQGGRYADMEQWKRLPGEESNRAKKRRQRYDSTDTATQIRWQRYTATPIQRQRNSGKDTAAQKKASQPYRITGGATMRGVRVL